MSTVKNPITVTGVGGSSDVVNGIIEQYKAESDTIDANTFVEFVNKLNYDSGDSVELPKASSYSPRAHLTRAIKLEDDKIFLFYECGGFAGMVAIVTVTGKELTLGTSVSLGYRMITHYTDSPIVRLTSEKVLVFCGSSSNTKLIAMVCSVSGTTITLGTSLTPDNYYNTAMGLGASLGTSSTHVVIAHPRAGKSSGTYDAFYAQTLSIPVSSTTISVGTTQQVFNGSLGVYVASLRHIPGSSSSQFYVVGFREGASYGISAVRLASTGTSSLSVGTVVNLVTTTAYHYAEVTLLQLGTGLSAVVYSYSDSSSSYANQFLDCAFISGSITPTLMANYQIMNAANSVSFTIYADLVDESNFCVTTGNLYIKIGFSNSNIESMSVAESPYNFTKIRIVPNSASTESLYFLYPSNTALLPIFSDDAIQKKMAQSGSTIQGLTKTACTADTPGDVWVLNTST